MTGNKYKTKDLLQDEYLLINYKHNKEGFFFCNGFYKDDQRKITLDGTYKLTELIAITNN